MKQVETTGKKVEDAIENGLRELGVSQSEVNIEILTLPGLFRRAKVRLTVVDENGNPVEEKVAEVKKEEKIVVKKEEKPAIKKEEKKFEKREVKEVKKEQKPEKKFEKSEIKKEQKVENKVEKKEVPAEQTKAEQPSEVKKIAEQQVEIARNYLSKLLSLMKIDATLEIDTTHGSIDVNIITEDTAVIGHRGEVLDALQILTKRAAEEGEDKFVRVNVDSKNYRVKRETSLVALAEKMAAKCIRTGRKVVLEPMSNTHRKVIHATLSSNNKVITKSEGREPNRRVIIIPKRYDKKRNDNNNN
jgi:spoIIIJ-associated protein